LDFGIAKIQQPEGARDHDITAANLVIGTPQYMSPEQCSQSGPIDARSDVYSLGVILFEMLAGRVPFTGDSPTVIMMKQVGDDPPSVLDARPDLSASIDNLIKKALAKQPSERFQTAGALYDALILAAAQTGAVTSKPVAPVADTVAITPVGLATADDLDEETVVRPREEVVRNAPEAQVFSRRIPDSAPAPNFNPWRIMAPAAIVLVAVFGIVFLLTRGTSQTPTNQSPGQASSQNGLVADPNSQPVQPTGTPTGEGERGIQPASSVSPLGRNANVSAEPTVVPGTSSGDFGANDNANSSAPTNKNANRRESPTPNSSPPAKKAEEPPPPRPVPSLKPTPKATATPEY
jgi:serine/threonine-protein kinase